MSFLSETKALLLVEPQCPLFSAAPIHRNDTEVPQVLDSDPTICLTLGANGDHWMQIALPYIRIKGQFYVSLIGNLKCSPTFGLSVSVISDCESGRCSYSQCIVSDLVTSDGLGGCKYRCHSDSVCNHIVVDIAGFSANNLFGTLCDIVF